MNVSSFSTIASSMAYPIDLEVDHTQEIRYTGPKGLPSYYDRAPKDAASSESDASKQVIVAAGPHHLFVEWMKSGKREL
jgi:hypothetical protein